MITKLQLFPYSAIRPQQTQIIEFIEKSLGNKEIAVIEAATGIGKTIAVITPLLDYLHSYNNNHDEPLKLVVTGRTHSQADRVITELSKIQNISSYPIRALSKRGKQSLCIKPDVKHSKSNQFQVICNTVKKEKKCKPFINAMIPANTKFVKPLLNQPVNSDEIVELSKLHNCCPAEITNQIIKEVDIISCSYHYLFSDKIRPRFLQTIESDLSQLIIVVDECHNLPSSTIQMNAIKINQGQLERALREINTSPLPEKLEQIRDMIEILALSVIRIIESSDEAFEIIPRDLLKKMENYMQLKGFNHLLKPEITAEIREISNYILKNNITKQFSHLDIIADLLENIFTLLKRNDHLILCYTYNETNYIELKTIDPAADIGKVLRIAHHSTLMTGTLGHPFIFKLQCGILHHAQLLQLPSPYEQDIGVYHVEGYTSKYSERGNDMYKKYVEIIHRICQSNVNIGLFVTSYTILDKLFEYGLDRTRKPIYHSTRDMNSHQTKSMVDDFRKSADQGGGLLCTVMGGRTSEGTDFPGKEMEIVIIAGIPFSPKTLEQEKIYEYYQKRTKSAWDICFTIPAFRTINQTAGRAIRSLSDRALIFLLDDRILKNSSKLTKWLRTSLKSISTDQVDSVVTQYFDDFP